MAQHESPITVYWPNGKKMRTLSDDDFKNLTAEELLSLHIEYKKPSDWYFSVYSGGVIYSTEFEIKGKKVCAWPFNEDNPKENAWSDKKDWYIWYCSTAGYIVCFKHNTFTPNFDIIEYNFDNRFSFLLSETNGISNSNRSARGFIMVD